MIKLAKCGQGFIIKPIKMSYRFCIKFEELKV